MAHKAIELLKYEGVEYLLVDLKPARDSAEYIRLFGRSEYVALLGKYVEGIDIERLIFKTIQ